MTLLSLGDSYTIGEGVLPNESFPFQTVKILNEYGLKFDPPHIVAKSGWTTNDLLSAIEANPIKEKFDFVTLLIGVNNQYQNRTLDEYTLKFEKLLNLAIGFANNQPTHVIVLSIPDWGVTPYAKNHDEKKITNEIDQFNRVNKNISQKFQIMYIDITDITRQAARYPSLLTTDQLHYSGEEYRIWAQMIAAIIKAVS